MEVIDLPFIKYTDPLAYLEDLRKPETQLHLQEEAGRWQNHLNGKKSEINKWYMQLKDTFDMYTKKPHSVKHISGHTLEIRYLDHEFYHLTLGKKVWPAVYNWSHTIDAESRPILLLIQDKTWIGSEDMVLSAWLIQKEPKQLWSINHVGPSMAVKGQRIYIQTCLSIQWYYRIEEINIKTGEQKIIVQSTTIHNVVVPLEVKGRHLWYMQEGRRFRNLMLCNLDTKRCHKVVDKSTNIQGFSYPYWYTDKQVFSVRSRQPVYTTGYNYITTISPFAGGFILVLIAKQIISIDYWHAGKIKKIFHPQTGGKVIITNVEEKQAEIIWMSPTAIPQKMILSAKQMLSKESVPKTDLESTYSIYMRDSYGIPVTTVYKKGQKPKALIAYVYGHYGIATPTRLSPRCWALMEEGYAFGFIGVRGGGDNGIADWDASRGNKRMVGLLDFISVIPQLQKSLGISANKTIITGRSAGGFHVANVATKVTNLASVCATVWAEAPFVEVIKGCVNDAIPVLRLEMDEFFDCRTYEGFRAALNVDPTMNIHTTSTVTVLASGGIHDSEVMYWEPLKWIHLLRKKGWTNTICRIDPATGHFMMGDYALQRRAEEYAVLDASIR